MTANQTQWVMNLGEQNNGIPQYNKSLFWIYSPRMQMLHAQWAALLESRTGTVLTQGVWSRCSSTRGGFNEHHGVAFRRMLCCLFNWVCPADSSEWCHYGFPLSIIPSLTCIIVFKHFSPYFNIWSVVLSVTTMLGNALLITSCICIMHPGAIPKDTVSWRDRPAFPPRHVESCL